jgi:hypothetical protein
MRGTIRLILSVVVDCLNFVLSNYVRTISPQYLVGPGTYRWSWTLAA